MRLYNDNEFKFWTGLCWAVLFSMVLWGAIILGCGKVARANTIVLMPQGSSTVGRSSTVTWTDPNAASIVFLANWKTTIPVGYTDGSLYAHSITTLPSVVEGAVRTATDPSHATAYSVNLDGTSDRFLVPHHAAFNVTTSGASITAWIKPDTMGYDYSGGSRSGRILRKGDFLDFQVRNLSGDNQLFGFGYPVAYPAAGQWIMVAATLQGTTVKLYTNQAQAGGSGVAGTLGSGPNTTAIAIGNYDTGTTTPRFFDGQIFRLTLYNKELSASEITNLFNYTSPTNYLEL